MWRPEGWENPFPKTKIVKLVSGRNHKKLDERNYYYEAGADAMHKADIEWILEHILITEGVFSKKDWEEFMF